MTTGGTFVYVSNADSRDIAVFKLDDAGGLSEVQRVTLEIEGALNPLAVSPDRRFLYAAQRDNPFPVTCFAIDQLTGELSYLSTAHLRASAPYIVTDRTGRWLFASSYQSSLVSVSPISAAGFVQPVHQVIRTPYNAHSIQIDAANRSVFVPCLGGDAFMQMRFDGVSGRLSFNTPESVRVGQNAGPRHFAFHPDNRHVYLLNELESSVYAYDFDASTGLLSEIQTILALPDGFDGPQFGDTGPSRNGGPKAADIHITPDGRFLYASERTTGTLSAYAVDTPSGLLTKIETIETEQAPRGFNIDPTGRYLICVGQASGHASAYSIDQASGQLSHLGRYETGRGPNWVEIHRLP